MYEIPFSIIVTITAISFATSTLSSAKHNSSLYFHEKNYFFFLHKIHETNDAGDLIIDDHSIFFAIELREWNYFKKLIQAIRTNETRNNSLM